MTKITLTRRAALTLGSLGAVAAPALLQAGPAAARAARGAAYEADRKAILAMAGDYHVQFDFRETVPFLDEYNPIDQKISGGDEMVRVIEDNDKRIALQHTLVMTMDGKSFVIKHWRQDWTYEPATVLVYAGNGAWKLEEVPAAQRAGAWSQTVWQTDDSPRYGGVGKWAHDLGVSRWTSGDTWRPLARRDAVRKPPYDRYLGINRHALTPSGWVHEQDNAKVGPKNGQLATFVHEIVLNTYDKDKKFNAGPGEAYWAATNDYWANVRSFWDEAVARGKGVKVPEEANNGSITGPKLMGWAQDIADGKTDTATAQAKALIASLG
jgi:hypothetical protein